MTTMRSKQVPGHREVADPLSKAGAKSAVGTVPLTDALDATLAGALDGKRVTVTFASANVALTVTHNLGRVPVGFVPYYTDNGGNGSVMTGGTAPVFYFVSFANATKTTMQMACTKSSMLVKGIIF